jgi:hypothetical protein
MKGLIHKYYLEIYKTDLKVCFHQETMEAKCKEDLSNFGGYVWWPKQDNVIWIYLPKKKHGGLDVECCAHECYHAADFIFQRTGMETSNNNSNEHMAYLIGFLVNKIFDLLIEDERVEKSLINKNLEK